MQKQDAIGDQPSYGKYGMLRKTYLKNHKPKLYSNLLGAGRLEAHLVQTDAQARSMMNDLVCRYLDAHPAPDKATQQMEWVGHINAASHSAEEFVLKLCIYCD